ncbi:hypothetical protein DSO57_1012462 [Entomophthora muscae]|uniref:Uncharacterized protein n=1 Tax=Entomophthora muscae TaxID=34485 RepID=A0ACC2RX37_9FUNG|nr:hypothetical protein DSO57_1012462 [Entomophthora muscae]
MGDCGTPGMQAAKETGALRPAPLLFSLFFCFKTFEVRECGARFIADCYFSVVNFGSVLFLGTGAVCTLATIAIVTIRVAVVMVGIMAFIVIDVFSAVKTAGLTRQQGSNQAGL